jgi:hypothetical protein
MKIGKYEFTKGEVAAGCFGAGFVLSLAVLGGVHPAPNEAKQNPNITAPQPQHCAGKLGALAVANEYKDDVTWRVTSIATGGEGDQSCVPVYRENGQLTNIKIGLGEKLDMACKYSATAHDVRVEIAASGSTFRGVAPISSDFLRNQTLGMCEPPEVSPLENR